MARRTIEMHHYRQALLRMRQGDSDRQIAAAKLMGRRAAAALRLLADERHWLDAGTLMPSDESIACALKPAKKASTTISSLEPHRTRMQAWFSQGVNGVVIQATLKRDFGWTGSYSAVRRMLGDFKKNLPPETTCRLDFEPGEAAQVDFGQGPLIEHPSGKLQRPWAFVMTLCFSRHQYVEFVWDQTVATWLGCHRRAFEWFGAVPKRLIIDNAKCAIVKACRFDPQVQRSYAECAEGYGFLIDPCPPYDPQKKGIVESGVKYLKGNFLPLRTFRHLQDLNEQAWQWVRQEASLRNHGTTRQVPVEMFALERPLMRTLPAVAPDIASWHQVSVHRDCHVKFDNALYSAPFRLVKNQVWLRVTDTIVAIHHDNQWIATHARAQRAGQRLTLKDHLPPNAQVFLSKDRAWLLEQSQGVGPHCEALIEQLLADRILVRLRSAQGVMGLAETFGVQRLEAACERALWHNSPYYKTLKGILQSGADQLPLPQQGITPSYRQARFARSAADLFESTHPQQDLLH